MNKYFMKSKENRDQVEKQYVQSSEETQRYCTHGPDCNAETVMLHGSGIYGKKVCSKYTDSAVVCTICKQIYESTNFTKEVLENVQYVNRSVLEQTKHMANLTDGDWNMIIKGYEALEVFEHIHEHYADMINKLASGNDPKGKKRRDNDKPNMFGPSTSMFGGSREY